MTQGENINILKKDISLMLFNYYKNKIRQLNIKNDFIDEYNNQFTNFIRHIEKKTPSIYNFIISETKSKKHYKANTDNFNFCFTINEDNSCSFEMTYIQKFKFEKDKFFLSNRIKEIYGYVYILESQFGYKIGCSSKLSNRLDQFGVLLPFKFNVKSVILCRNWNEIEQMLHDLLKHKRLNGEWFDLTESDFTEMDLLLGNLKLKRIDYDPILCK